MSGRYILALDQGTTGSTALVVDADGEVRARGYAELPQYYPGPGWVEHDPEEIWATVGQCRRTAPACDRLRAEGLEATVRERTGLVLDAYFSGTKIAWLLDAVP